MKNLIDRFKRLPLPAQIGIGAFAALVVLALVVGIIKNVGKQRDAAAQQPSQVAVQPAAQPAFQPFQQPAAAPSHPQPAAQAPAVAPTVITSAAALPLDAQMKENSVNRTLFVRTEARPDIEIERSVLNRTSFSVDTDSPAIAAAGITWGTWIAGKFVAFVRVEKDERIAFSVTSESDGEHTVAIRIDDRKAGESKSNWTANRYASALLVEEMLAAGYHKIELEVSQYSKRQAAVRVAVKPASEPNFRDIVPYIEVAQAPVPAAAAVKE